MPVDLTDKEVGTYLVYRVKLNELIHLNFLFDDLNRKESVSGLDAKVVAETLRTAVIAWFCTIVDKRGLNIFDLWIRIYPQYQKRIRLVRLAIYPHVQLIRAFRDKAAFHAERNFSDFLKPRLELLKETKPIVKALQHFLKLAEFLMRREEVAIPRLSSRLLDVILDTELKLKCSINRQWFIKGNIVDRHAVFRRECF